MWSKPKGLTRVLCVVCALALLALSAVLVVGLLIPYMGAKSSMDTNGVLTVSTCEDGTLQLQWPEGENAQGYAVQVVDAKGNTVYSVVTAECAASLSELPDDQ